MVLLVVWGLLNVSASCSMYRGTTVAPYALASNEQKLVLFSTFSSLFSLPILRSPCYNAVPACVVTLCSSSPNSYCSIVSLVYSVNDSFSLPLLPSPA